MPLTESELQELLMRKAAELEREVDALEAANEQSEEGKSSERDEAEAAELAAVPRSKFAAEQRRAIREKYARQRAEQGDLKLSKEGQVLQNLRAASDAELFGFPENSDSVGELERAYLKAKAAVRPGDMVRIQKIKQAYRREFLRLGYRLND